MRDLQSLRLMPAPYQSVALTQPARPFEFASEAATVTCTCLGLLGCTSMAPSVAPFDVSDLAPPGISASGTAASEAPEAAASTNGGQDPCPVEARPAKRRRLQEAPPPEASATTQQAPPPDPASATTQQAPPPDPASATTQQAQPTDPASATTQQAAAPGQPAPAPDDHGAAAAAAGQLQLVAAAAAAAAPQPLVLALPYGDAASRQRWYEQYETAAAHLGAIQAAEAKAGQPLCNDRPSVLEYSTVAAASNEATASADQRWQQDPSSRRRRQGGSAAAGRGDPGPSTSRGGSGAQRADANGAVAAGNGTASAAVAEGPAGRRHRGGRRVAAAQAGGGGVAGRDDGAQGAARGAAAAAAAAGQGRGGDLSEEEVVVHVVMHHGHARSRPLMEVLVLGSQTVAQLRDVLACPTDTFLAGFQQGRGGAAILLEDALLVDRRGPDNHDYSQEILRFCREHDTARPRPRKSGGTVMEAVVKPGQGQEPRVLQMEATQWGDLALRCGDGMGYLYLHQGCCEHRLEIRDVRQLHPLDRQNRSDYPLVVHTEPLSRRQCSICQRAPAAHVTLEDPLAPCHPCWMCDACYGSLHFDAAGGRLAPDVRVVPYVGE